MNKFRIILIVIGSFIFCRTVSAAAVVDAVTYDDTRVDRTSVTLPVTVASGATILVVTVAHDYGSGDLPAHGVQYNGSDMIKYWEDVSGNTNPVSIWYTANPTSGTHNVVATAAVGNRQFNVGAISFLTSATIPTGLQDISSSGTSASLTVTSTVNSYVIDIQAMDQATNNVGSQDWGATSVYLAHYTGSFAAGFAYGVGAASVNTTRSWSGSEGYTYAAASIDAAAPAGGGGVKKTGRAIIEEY